MSDVVAPISETPTPRQEAFLRRWGLMRDGMTREQAAEIIRRMAGGTRVRQILMESRTPHAPDCAKKFDRYRLDPDCERCRELAAE